MKLNFVFCILLLQSCSSKQNVDRLSIVESEKISVYLGPNHWSTALWGNVRIFKSSDRIYVSLFNLVDRRISLFDLNSGSFIRNYHYTVEGPNAVIECSDFVIDETGNLYGMGNQGMFILDSLSQKKSVISQKDLRASGDLNSNEYIFHYSPWVGSIAYSNYKGSFLWCVLRRGEPKDTIHFLAIDTTLAVDRWSIPVKSRADQYLSYDVVPNITLPQYIANGNRLYMNYSFDNKLLVYEGEYCDTKELELNFNLMPPINSTDAGILIKHLESHDVVSAPIINNYSDEIYFLLSKPIEGSYNRDRTLVVFDAVDFSLKSTYAWPDNYTNDIFSIDQYLYAVNKDVDSEDVLEIIRFEL